MQSKIDKKYPERGYTSLQIFLKVVQLFAGFSSDTKGDLIAELKLSHTIGGISKLRNEQVG